MVKRKKKLAKIKHKTISKEKIKIKEADSKEVAEKKEVHVVKSIEKTHEKHGEVLEKYTISIDKVNVEVQIEKSASGLLYNLKNPDISQATASLLSEIRNELITVTAVNTKELVDPEAFVSIRNRFTDEARKLIKSKLPNIEVHTEDLLVGKLMQDMLGLGKIEFLISDPSLEEIVITSSKEPIRVYNKKYGWLNTSIKVEREEEIVNYANIIARRVGRQINVLTPLLDAHLVSGDRVNAVLYPINTKGSTITIRKFARDPYTIIDLIKNKTCDLDTASLLWMAIEYEMNVLVSGGTASGKTVFLNAFLPFIPPNQRILSIEDTRELMLPNFLYWTPLVTRTPNAEGKGEVSMLDLLINALRMRPDRIILGEMRKKEEAMVLFEAMHTGHSVYATLHADSASETISRLINPPLSVPANLLKSVNLNVVMFRDRKKGIRRVLHIAEFDTEKGNAKSSIIYRWVPEEDKIIKHGEGSKFFDDLSRHTGMSEKEIKEDLEERKNLLLWLSKNNIRDLSSFGKFTNIYYKNKQTVVDAMRKNDTKLFK